MDLEAASSRVVTSAPVGTILSHHSQNSRSKLACTESCHNRMWFAIVVQRSTSGPEALPQQPGLYPSSTFGRTRLFKSTALDLRRYPKEPSGRLGRRGRRFFLTVIRRRPFSNRSSLPLERDMALEDPLTRAETRCSSSGVLP